MLPSRAFYFLPITSMAKATTSPTHSPGPWYIGSPKIDDQNIIFSETKDLFVCSTNPDDPSQDANARLIADAPELLDHLKHIVEMARSVSANWENGDLAVAVRNLERIASSAEVAIHRAEGRG